MSGSDNDLLIRVAEGAETAFETLLARHRAPVSGLAYRLLGNRAEADEVAQETFGRVWSHAPRWRPDGQAKSWIFRIAHNLCIDRLRARRPTVDIEDREIEDRSDTPEHAASKTETAKRLHEALASLPERQRMAIALFHLKDMTADLSFLLRAT